MDSGMDGGMDGVFWMMDSSRAADGRRLGAACNAREFFEKGHRGWMDTL